MEKQKTVYSQADIIDSLVAKLVDENIKISKKDAKAILNSLQEVIYDKMIETTEDTNIEVKIGKGIGYIGTMADSREGRNPSTGESMTIPAQIRIRGKVTKSFKDAVNEA